jgi:hypothetical protein
MLDRLGLLTGFEPRSPGPSLACSRGVERLTARDDPLASLAIERGQQRQHAFQRRLGRRGRTDSIGSPGWNRSGATPWRSASAKNASSRAQSSSDLLERGTFAAIDVKSLIAR